VIREFRLEERLVPEDEGVGSAEPEGHCDKEIHVGLTAE